MPAPKKYKTKIQAKKAKIESIARSQKRTMKAYTLRFHNVNDEAVIARLEAMPNKADYIRQLILADLAKEE